MKLTVLTLLYKNYTLEECFQIASAQGYDGIEIWGARPHAYINDLTPEYLEKIRGWKEKYGLEISMFTPEVLSYPYNLSSPIALEREETVEYLKKNVRAAAAMGTDKMQITCGHCGFHTDKETAWGWLVSGMKEIAAEAEEAGVDLIIEALSQMEGNMVIRCDDIRRLIKEVGGTRVKAMIDTVTPVLMAETYSEYFMKLGKDMEYVHFVNSDGATPNHLNPDTGVVPMPELLKLLKDFGYDGWISCERMNDWDPALVSAQYINEMKELIKEL